MKDINQMTISGVVQKPPRTGDTKNGKQWASVTLAVIEDYNGQEFKTLIGVKGFGDAAGSISNLVEGQRVVASGKMAVDSYTPQGSNEKKFFPVCVANAVIPMDGASHRSDDPAPRSQPQAARSRGMAPDPSGRDLDDLPF